MFQKKFRLSAVTRLSPSTTFFSPFFVCKFGQNHLENNRYGFVVSKKVDKRAVRRNSVKRRLRAQVELFHKKMPQGYDFLFILKKEAVGQKSEIFSREIQKLEKLVLLKENEK